MILEELNKSRVNVKDLSIKEPEGKGVPLFDPRKEIKEEQWTEMIDDIGASAWGGFGSLDQGSAIPFIETIRVAYPEKAQTIHETYVFAKYLTERIEATSKAEAESDTPPQLSWHTIISNLRELIHVEPEAISGSELQRFLLEGSWKVTLDELKKTRRESVSNLFPGFAFSARIVFPEQFAALNIDKTFNKPWKDLPEELEHLREEGKRWPERFMAVLSHQLSRLRVIDPEGFSQKMILESDWASWKGLLKKLWEYRKSDRTNYQSFAELIMNMSILGAKEIKITDHGLEPSGLELKEGFVPDITSNVPETRKF